MKRYMIHPAIGIARVGNSSEFYLDSDTYGQVENNRYKDDLGRVKKKAVKFNVIEYEYEGSKLISTKILTEDDYEINWSVRLVNKKAVAPNFDERGFRNQDYPNKEDLTIDSNIKYAKRSSDAVSLEGKFKGESINLGKIFVDDNNSLFVLGGDGKSIAIPKESPIRSFANNDNWCDDTSDGIIKAEIKVNNESIEAEPAWLIVAPPDYAPHLKSIVSLWDIVYHAAAEKHDDLKVKDDSTVIFQIDILPILERMTHFFWVADWDETFIKYGDPNSSDYLLKAENLERLSNPLESSKSYRETIFKLFRNPNRIAVPEEGTWPPVQPGSDANSNRENAAYITPTQYKILELWKEGKFINISAEELPLDDPSFLPLLIDKQALDYSIGVPFFPGIEVGVIIKGIFPGTISESIYSEEREKVFRINHKVVEPGDLTKFNALPWQADFIDCSRSWWPVQRPYVTFKSDEQLKPDLWIPTPSFNPDKRHKYMVENWQKLGFVVNVGNEEVPRFQEVDRNL